MKQFKCPYSGSPFMDLPSVLGIFVGKDDGLILLSKENTFGIFSTWEMSWWVKCSLCKDEDLNSDAQHPYKSQARMHLSVTPDLGGWELRQAEPRSYSPVCLVKTASSRISERPCLKIWRGGEEDTQHRPLASECIHTGKHNFIDIHMHTHMERGRKTPLMFRKMHSSCFDSCASHNFTEQQHHINFSASQTPQNQFISFSAALTALAQTYNWHLISIKIRNHMCRAMQYLFAIKDQAFWLLDLPFSHVAFMLMAPCEGESIHNIE